MKYFYRVINGNTGARVTGYSTKARATSIASMDNSGHPMCVERLAGRPDPKKIGGWILDKAKPKTLVGCWVNGKRNI